MTKMNSSIPQQTSICIGGGWTPEASLIASSGPVAPFVILTGAVGGVLIGSVNGGCFD